MVQIIDRRKNALGGQKWGRSEKSIKNISWHYTAVRRQSRSFITNHERYWRNTLGWTFGGYHYYIDADGKIYQNYDLTTISNGVKYHNSNTVHISVEANSASNYSKAQVKARKELTLYLMKRLNLPASAVKGHKEFSRQSTSCPGYSVTQMNAFRKELAGGKAPSKPSIKENKKESKPKPSATGQRLHLPATVDSWNIYKANGPYTRGNQINELKPSKFGGLSYDILGNPVPDVYLIGTSDFGTVAIYAGRSTSATISGSGAGNAKPKPSKANGQTLHLPASAKTWKVYNVNGPYTSGNEIHLLTPSKFGGISYKILGNPAPHVYIIKTGVKGQVAIYAGPNTSAKITGRKKKVAKKPKSNKISTTLRRGSRGSDVTKLQNALVRNNFYPNKRAKNNGVDGIYGGDTESAVKRYQLMNGLSADGIAGPKTLRKLGI